ncbi:MAG: hypothetical protein FJ265_03830 [Planctomycetes bacterium]|nr:hypothetical protein [Planctomycetota bacterium]
MLSHTFALPALLSGVLAAQNLVPDGEFHQGGSGWTRISFNDPLGSTGFAAARVANQGPSMALFADFQTLTSVMTATWQSPSVVLPAGPLPVGYRVMWEKQVTMPIPSPTSNRVELRIYDSTTNTLVYTGTQPSPNQTGFLERAQFSALPTIPATGAHHFQVFMRHSNVAVFPFKCWVDDVYVGGLVTEVYGQGCAGSGGFVPVIGSSNAPLLNSSNFTLELNDAFAPGLAVVVADLQNAVWAGGPLPWQLGGGCALLTGPAASVFVLMPSGGAGTGVAAVPFAIGNNPGFAGLDFYAQWGVSDPAAPNPYGFTTTAGYRFTIQ